MKEHIEGIFSEAISDAQQLAKTAIIYILSTKSMSTIIRPKDIANLDLSWDEVIQTAEKLTDQKICRIRKELNQQYIIFERITALREEEMIAFTLDAEFYDFLFLSYTTNLKIAGIGVNTNDWEIVNR
jgi:hypothetical protein